MQEKIEDIKHIQNTIWAMYKDFLSGHDMKKWNDGIGNLTQEYYEKGDPQLLTFCQYLLISWTPIINGFAEEYYGGGKK